jgi:hypothetical protein
MSAPETPLQPDFRERAKTNDVAVARLIGFEAKDVADGHATVTLSAGPQHANPMGTLHGGILCDIADAAMGAGVRKHTSAGGDSHYGRAENKLLSPGLAGATQSGRNRRAAGPNDGLCGVHHNRRGEPSGSESSVHVHGASRPEGHRTVMPASLALRVSRGLLFLPASRLGLIAVDRAFLDGLSASSHRHP